jgi:hypothetical protein
VGFHVLFNQGRAIMHNAKVPRKCCYLLWREAFQTATKLEGYKHWNGDNPKFAANLRTWGEAGVVKFRHKFTKKIDDRRYICMFVGYPDNHYDDTFRMWDPRSKREHITCNISWLNTMYFSMIFTNNFDNSTLSIKVREGDNQLLESENCVNSPYGNNETLV